MAGGPRSDVIDNTKVGTYHCFNRCVRRAYLCGEDAVSGKNYDHRKEWIRLLLIEFASIFAIDILKYAVQDNHFHVLLRNRPDLVRHWSVEKVLRQAMRLFPEKFRRMKLYAEPHEELPPQLLKDKELIAEMRERLSSISWLMKVLQERVAKRANREDEITGTFWDGRFGCEAILDDGAALACALYIDLNPLRAGRFATPEQSRYTSAYDRIAGLRARRKKRMELGVAHDGFLSPLNALGDYENEDLAGEGKRASNKGIFELPLVEYLTLLDHVGRQVRGDKRGAIPANLPPIIERIGLDPEHIADCVKAFSTMSRRAVGSIDSLRKKANNMGKKWLQGVKRAKTFYLPTKATAGK